MSQLWRISVQRLGRDLSEASELATVLQEVAPDLQVEGLSHATPSRPSSSSGTPTAVSARERVHAAQTIEVGPSCVPWRELQGVVSSEVLHEPGPTQAAKDKPQLLEVNTGGSVFFLLFRGEQQQQQNGAGGRSRLASSAGPNCSTAQACITTSARVYAELSSPERAHPHPERCDCGSSCVSSSSGPGVPSDTSSGCSDAEECCCLDGGGARVGVPGVREGVAVLKVASSRLAMQAEQFANELARHLGIAAPLCRLVRQSGDGAGEWAAARDGAERLGDGGDEMSGELGRMPCFLLMEYVAGRPLLAGSTAFQGPDALPLLEDVGRLLLLDMLLGNADRLPFPDLGWRGNPSNVLLGAPGSKYAGRAVAIDSCVARRPPALKSCAEDAAVERMAQLVLMAPDVAASVLRQILGPEAGAAALAAGGGQGPNCDGVGAFQRGFRETLSRVLRIKGLLEMMQSHTAEWVAEFFDDVAPLVPGLKGPQGNSLPLPLGELAAGMRTPSHLVAAVSPSPRQLSCGSLSARMSPRSSFHNRELPGMGPGGGGGSSLPSPGGVAGGAAGGAAPSAFSPARPNSRGSSCLQSRSFTLGHRAYSGPLGAAGCSPLISPAPSGGLAPDVLISPARAAAAAADSKGQVQGQGGWESAAVPLSAAAAARAAFMPRLLMSRSPSSAPGSNHLEQPLQQQDRQQAARPLPLGGAAEGVSRRLSYDDAPCSSWRSAAPSITLSPQRSPRDNPLDAARASGSASLSQAVSSALASIASEARHDEALAERVSLWKERFRDRASVLASAITSWQARHSLERVLTTGFLDGSHPLVDAYELAVRLEHMLRRLAALQGAATAEAPCQVVPRLFLGGAVAADSHYLLAHMGLTHVLNATEELLLPPASAGFEAMRVPLRDTDTEDIGFHFERVHRWIDDALACGGAVLVHCHEGKSRSVTLAAAYLMLAGGMDLASALKHIRSVRPGACPNAGFMSALMDLDQTLHGSRSVSPSREAALAKRGKPAARTCPICSEAVGVSSGSLEVHMKSKHRQPALCAAPEGSSPRS